MKTPQILDSNIQNLDTMVHRHQGIVHPWSKMTWTKSAEMKKCLKERICVSFPRLVNIIQCSQLFCSLMKWSLLC